MSPVYKKSGWTEPLDDTDELEIYRCNLGVVTLNLPMIWMKAKKTGSDFWETLTEYMEIARGIHKKTAEYLYKMKASSNPLAFMQGGFDGGTLEAHESVEPVLRKSTLSFGYGGLHEITMLQCKKGLSEDTDFAKTVLKYINAEIQRFKAEDKLLYALYGKRGCRTETTKPA